MAPEPLQFSIALMIGLLGATHCVGMCGGIAASVSLSQGDSRRGIPLIIAYNIGRITSYAVAGALIGLLGYQISGGSTGIILRTLAAVLLILMGLYVAQWWQLLTRLERAGGLLWRYLRPLAAKLLPADTLPRALLLGTLWGWLPCGLVYSTLIWSSAAGHWYDSALLMIGFGLGTLPAMLTTGLLAQQVRSLMQRQGVRRGAGVLIILFGVYTLPISALTGH
ncbi:sulfite exporter TauE/SafE family protein [Marinobacterium sp. YM272]|uniref:sulfite exporter TauE/SafE family protein n=1 Tax=Marinobacterium sp. YM272 TaxID=3421654 RepID=UPI003D7FC02C